MRAQLQNNKTGSMANMSIVSSKTLLIFLFLMCIQASLSLASSANCSTQAAAWSMEGTCGNTTGSSSSGAITDGQGDYSASERCYWRITTAADVEIDFTSFETEELFDKLEVWSCKYWSPEMPCTNCDQVLGSFSGSLGNFSFSAPNSNRTNRCITLAFFTDPMTQLPGFDGRWSLRCPQG
eukprot:206090-Hanusia_phi.AAC.2